MKKILLTALSFTTFIGVICIAVNLMMGTESITYISTYSIGNTGLSMYRFDLNGYVKNLQEEFNRLQLTVVFPNIPTLPVWEDIDGWTIAMTFIAKCLCYIINWLVYILNLTLLLPLKVIFHMAVCLCALLGINTSTIGQLMTKAYQFNIEYIPLQWFTSGGVQCTDCIG